ncbi:MAG: BON domain-containing protein [Alphaproteobacteria bacterium]|nr:BON domain-containing protein [Alphaproteobacteria bacterium]MBU0859475.1 BON domain-containing protein [Alphaproteobacteria bacterium]
MNRSVFLLSALLASVALSACTPVGVVAGTGASLGVASMKEGGIRSATDDLRIKALISDLWFKYDLKTFAKLSTTVNQGRVLITGVVQNPDDRVEAVRLAWQVDGVVQVINEIRVADSDGVPGYVRDQWITTRLRTAIMFSREIHSINYSIDTVQGTIYLMGVAQNQAELDKVIEAGRTIPHVREVVSYVKMAGQPIPAQNSAPSLTAADTASSYNSVPSMPAAPVGSMQSAPVDSEALPPW